MKFFATAAKGTEVALRDELREKRFRGVRADRGGVAFEGGLAEGARACLESRVAMRVLCELDRFDAPSEDALYEGVRAIAWDAYLHPGLTLAVRASAQRSKLTHTQYLAQLCKDAIVDQQRDALGRRSNVDPHDPDLLVSLHLAKDVATIYLDVGGGPLFQRGYRTEHAGAPLKETLAAAIVRLSGWDRRRPLYDPMCGSGTLLIEAALWAFDLPPGALDPARRFGLERWASSGEEARRGMKELRDAARARFDRPREELVFVGRDRDPEAIAIAGACAARAGVAIRLEQAELADFDEPGAIQIVTNPPYGERLDLPPHELRTLGLALTKNREARVAMLAGTPALLEAMRRRPSKTYALMNGDIECRLALWEPRVKGGEG